MATSPPTAARPTSGTWARRDRQPQRHLLTLDGLRRQRQRGARSVARRGGDVDLDGLRLRAQRGAASIGVAMGRGWGLSGKSPRIASKALEGSTRPMGRICGWRG